MFETKEDSEVWQPFPDYDSEAKDVFGLFSFLKFKLLS